MDHHPRHLRVDPMTAACGLAGRFSTLFLARVGVGVGEVVLSPAAYSMISDMFPGRSGWDLRSAFTQQASMSARDWLIVGGLAAQKMLAIGVVTIPVIGTTSPLQTIFLSSFSVVPLRCSWQR